MPDKKIVCAVVAHPDDEVLMAGGRLAWHASAGDIVHILFMATGATARGGDQGAYVSRLRDQAQKAGEILGAASVNFHGWPDNRMDTVPFLDVVQKLEAFLAQMEPTEIYTHYAGDLNLDHRVTSRAVLTACRPVPGAATTTILAGETNSSTEWAAASAEPFRPTEFFDISAVLSRKLLALACYADEMRPWPHPRSAEGVRALAAWRGAQSGVEAAEAFTTIRRVHRHSA